LVNVAIAPVFQIVIVCKIESAVFFIDSALALPLALTANFKGKQAQPRGVVP